MSHDNATDNHSYSILENSSKIFFLQFNNGHATYINCAEMPHTVNLLRIEEFHNRTSLWVGLSCSSLVEGKGHAPRAGERCLPINSNVKH